MFVHPTECRRALGRRDRPVVGLVRRRAQQLGQGLRVDATVLAQVEAGELEAEGLRAPFTVAQQAVGETVRALRAQAVRPETQVVAELAGPAVCGAHVLGAPRLPPARPPAPGARRRLLP